MKGPPKRLSAEEIENLPEQYASHIFVGRLTANAGEAQIRGALEGFGEIVRVNVAKDQRGHKGFAFAVFRSKDEAKEVLRNGPEVSIDNVNPSMARNGRTITVGPYIYSERQKAYENNQLEEFKKTVDESIPTSRAYGKPYAVKDERSPAQRTAVPPGPPSSAPPPPGPPKSNDIPLPGLPPEGDSGPSDSGLALVDDEQQPALSSQFQPRKKGPAAGARGAPPLQLADSDPPLQLQPQPPVSAPPEPGAGGPVLQPAPPSKAPLQPQQQQQLQQQSVAVGAKGSVAAKRKRAAGQDDETAKQEISKMQDHLRHIMVGYYRDALALQGQGEWQTMLHVDEGFGQLRDQQVQELEERRAEVYGSPKDTPQLSHHQPYLQPVWRPESIGFTPATASQATPIPHQRHSSQRDAGMSTSQPVQQHHQHPQPQVQAKPQSHISAGSVGLSPNGSDESVPLWHYRDPSGQQHGPFSLSQLRQWSESLPHDLGIWQDGAITCATLSHVLSGKENASIGDMNANVWKYLDASGNVQGPFSLTQLAQWHQFFPPRHTVFTDGRPPLELTGLLGSQGR